MGYAAASARRSNLPFALLLGGAVLSYMSQSVGQLVGYILALSGLAGLALSWPIVSRARVQIVFVLCMGMLLISLFSMLAANQYATGMRFVIQSAMYPLVLAALLLYGWRVLESDRKKLARLVAGVGTLNAVVALLASLGLVSSLPLVGEISTGRYIFGTQIPSSTGMAINVNYYSTLQGSIFLLYGWLLSDLGARRKWYHLGIGAFLLGTILIGSSRGVAAAMMAAGTAWLAIHFLHLRFQTKLQYLPLAGSFMLVAAYLVVAHWGWVSEAFRFDRGLNFRDVIWSAGIQLWLERPLMGYGYAGATSEMLGDMIGRAGSLHSGYLSTLNRGGVLLFMFVYGGVIAIVLLGLGMSRERWWRNRWPVAIVVFWLANSAIRTFNLGGLGLLPVAAVLALSVILYARYRERLQLSSSVDTGRSAAKAPPLRRVGPNYGQIRADRYPGKRG